MDKCIGQSGTPYLGMQSGAEVLLTDGAGATIGASYLVEAADSASSGTEMAAICHFIFSFPDTKKADFYIVTLNGVKGPTYSYDELASQNWVMSLK